MLHFGLGSEADNEQNMVLQLLILDFVFWSKKIRCKLTKVRKEHRSFRCPAFRICKLRTTFNCFDQKEQIGRIRGHWFYQNRTNTQGETKCRSWINLFTIFLSCQKGCLV